MANLNTAIANCAAANSTGSYLLLGSGTFTVSSTIALASNVTLRGAGPMSTILNVSSSAVVQLGTAITMSYCTVTAGSNYSQGSTTVICNSLTGTAPAAGDIGYLVQCDTGFSGGGWQAGAPYYGAWACITGSPSDNGAIYVCNYNTPCTQQVAAAYNAYEIQSFYISNASNSSGTYTITVTPGLVAGNWAYAQMPGFVIMNPADSITGAGLEDVTVSGSSSSGAMVSMAGCYGCWEKGIRVIGSGAYFVSTISTSVKSAVLNSYFWGDPASDASYPPAISPSTTTDMLYLNNMMFAESEPIEDYGGNVGVVEAYNFARDSFTAYPFNTSYDHHGFDAYNLFEGNQFGEYTEDNTWSTHALHTFFRNLGLCSDVPYTTYGDVNTVAYDQANYQRFNNVIGNAWGSSQCTAYQQSFATAGYIYQIFNSDALSVASLMRWGNVSVVTQSSDTPTNSGIRFVASEVPNSTNMSSGTYPNATTWQNSTPANNNLPCSFYFSIGSSPCSPKYSGGTGLSWYKVCKTWSAFPTSCSATQTQPFPIAGPDMTSGNYVNGYAYDAPAAIAWENLPIDTSYQSSYTITGSSWSGQLETLTISGLPNTTHLMGAFQLSGVNSACTTGAFMPGANSEILMTGSTSTTVVYALASNPGVSCTGTMKFPDVRQFDERVYESDSSGTTYTWTPTIVGSGSLTGSNCSSASYSSGATIGACTAVPGTGYSFTGWSSVSGSAACSGSTNPCPSFSITANSAATATFTANSTGAPPQLLLATLHKGGI